MSETFTLDRRAFNRGVDKVLTLKPLRAAAQDAISRSARVVKGQDDQRKAGTVVTRREKGRRSS